MIRRARRIKSIINFLAMLIKNHPLMHLGRGSNNWIPIDSSIFYFFSRRSQEYLGGREGKGWRVFGLIEMKRRYRSIGSVNKSLLIARNVETDWFGCFPAIVDIDDVDLRCGFRLGVDIWMLLHEYVYVYVCICVWFCFEFAVDLMQRM